MKKAYVTVFFTIATALSLSLFISLLYGIRDSASRMKVVSAADTAMTSAFAEYNRELWKQYNLIFTDSSYQTRNSSMFLAEERLKDCINTNFDESGSILLGGKDLLKLECNGVETKGVRLATDNCGQAVYNQAVLNMKYKYGIEYFANLLEWVDVIETQNLEDSTGHEEVAEAEAALEEYGIMDYSGWIPYLSENENPDEAYLAPTSILRRVIQNPEEVSLRTIDESIYAGKRELNRGTSSATESAGLLDKLLFREYLREKTGNYATPKEGSCLSYETEYLIVGKSSDVKNLQSVVYRILIIREAANMITLLSDDTKMLAIDVIAAAVAALLLTPAVATIVKSVIVAGWSYFESIADLKVLMAGKEVPLIKRSDDWQTDLDSVLSGIGNSNGHEMSGLGYEDYLRIFLYLNSDETLIPRLMTVMETDIRNVEGYEAFRIDNCFDDWEVNIYVSSMYGYDYYCSKRKKN